MVRVGFVSFLFFFFFSNFAVLVKRDPLVK